MRLENVEKIVEFVLKNIAVAVDLVKAKETRKSVTLASMFYCLWAQIISCKNCAS